MESMWHRWRKAPTTIICDEPVEVPLGADLYICEDWRPILYSDRLKHVLETMEEPVALVAGIDRFLLDYVPPGLLDAVAAT